MGQHWRWPGPWFSVAHHAGLTSGGVGLEERPEVIALGLLAQQCWSRWGQPRRKGQETRRQLMSRARESQRWGAVLEAGGPPAGSTWIYVADRESDFYEPIERCQRQGVDFIIRACHDRALSGGQGHLKDVSGSGAGARSIEGGPARPARASRANGPSGQFGLGPSA